MGDWDNKSFNNLGLLKMGWPIHMGLVLGLPEKMSFSFSKQRGGLPRNFWRQYCMLLQWCWWLQNIPSLGRFLSDVTNTNVNAHHFPCQRRVVLEEYIRYCSFLCFWLEISSAQIHIFDNPFSWLFKTQLEEMRSNTKFTCHVWSRLMSAIQSTFFSWCMYWPSHSTCWNCTSQ